MSLDDRKIRCRECGNAEQRDKLYLRSGSVAVGIVEQEVIRITCHAPCFGNKGPRRNCAGRREFGKDETLQRERIIHRRKVDDDVVARRGIEYKTVRATTPAIISLPSPPKRLFALVFPVKVSFKLLPLKFLKLLSVSVSTHTVLYATPASSHLTVASPRHRWTSLFTWPTIPFVAWRLLHPIAHRC